MTDQIDRGGDHGDGRTGALLGEVADGLGDVTDAVGARLSMVVGQLVRVLRRHAPTDIGPGSLAALATVWRQGPMRLGELAAREGVAPPTLTRIVAALEDAGYVTREPDPSDRRAVRVAITDAGTQLVIQVMAGRADALACRLERLPADQQTTLAAALPALEALARDPH
ncbi:MAG TPA: MarR family transcriptional regulator [Kineosporiaceae bacterium]|nr:MarR family transcriptional regulator [Kineosporiaceae bacterium]